MKEEYDVLIIGGGPAGLAAALTLGRMLRTALICDDGRPRNLPSSHLNNFPTRDGIHPALWREEAKKNLEKYSTIECFSGSVLVVRKVDEVRFHAEFSFGAAAYFSRVILAYGVQDQPLAVPGFEELWGKAVFHCPYCHGFESRGAALGLVANGAKALHLLPLCHGLSENLVLFTHGKAEFSPEELAMLDRRKVGLEESPIRFLDFEGGTLKFVELEDGRSISRDALFAAPGVPFKTKSEIGTLLGCEKSDTGLYQVTLFNETSVKGVYAAGDNMTMQHSVLHACAHGATAGAGIVFDLLNQAFAR